MLFIAVVDDSPQDAALLRQLIERSLTERGQTCRVHVYQDGVGFIRSEETYDMAFLDIHMSRLDGLEAAHFLRRLSSQTELVFVTNMAQMAIRGYEVDAVDFIIKPASKAAIDRVIGKVLGRINAQQGKTIALKTAKGTFSVQTGAITFVEVYGHALIYHTEQGDYSLRGQLVEAAKQLDPKQFMLCSRSYLVNLRYIQSVEPDRLVVQGKSIPISRAHRKAIEQRFISYLGEQL